MFQRYAEIQRRRSLGKDEGGFTLIELLIVIVVLGILAAVVVFALGGVTGQSAVSACNSDAKTVETAYAAYQAQGGAAISNTNAVQATAQQAVATAVKAALVPAYLHSWPSSGHYSLFPNSTYASGAATSNGDVLVSTTGNIAVTAMPTSGLVSYDGQTTTTGCNGVS